MKYTDAINYLNGFVNFEHQPDSHFNTRKDDLIRFRELLTRLGKPQSRYPVIHIVGTKGKGSTGALIASVLHQAGYKVGLFTSPHLVTVRERIRIGQRMISKREFARIISIIRNQPKNIRTGNHRAFRTVFEHLTALALVAFSRQSVDIAVLEAGLGGKLDSTVVTDPILTVTTPVGLDHQAILGDTIAEIAADKACAIKPSIPVVTAPQDSEAMREIVKQSEKRRAPLTIAPGSLEFQILKPGISSSTFQASRDWMPDAELKVGLAGEFQLENVSTAISAVEYLKASGFVISREALQKGLSRVRFEGRLQVLPANVPIFLDGAHNTMAIRVIVQTLHNLIRKRRFRVVFSAMKNKPVGQMLDYLQDSTVSFYLAPLQFPKSLNREMLEELSLRLLVPSQVFRNVPEAYDTALRDVQTNEAILVTGSLYLVGEVLRHVRGNPPPVPDGQIDPRI